MIDANTYSEVYEILSYMDKATVMKIPIEILENIKAKRNTEYMSRINPQDIFNKNNVNEKTLQIIACLDVNYWMTKENKKNLELKYIKKIKEEELEKKKKYGNQKLFDKKFEISLQLKDNEQMKNNFITEYKESFFTRFRNCIFKLLHINK